MKIKYIPGLPQLLALCGLFVCHNAFAFYNSSTGRWLSRDPVEESDGANIYVFLRNDGISSTDYMGLEWQIQRRGGLRADAKATSTSDTFDDLARNIGLDTSDYKKWAQTSDTKPNLCAVYSIPNTIYIDYGEFKVLDQVPWSIISIWRSQASAARANWEKNVFSYCKAKV
ncbi:MAG TPA: RHS repeat-associated core domain-containing protein [Candidatus Angelobacter sp.]|nr:RHS repeat-associated core domain-containing protein [Candidatus Angelobacter sp.]